MKKGSKIGNLKQENTYEGKIKKTKKHIFPCTTNLKLLLYFTN